MTQSVAQEDSTGDTVLRPRSDMPSHIAGSGSSSPDAPRSPAELLRLQLELRDFDAATATEARLAEVPLDPEALELRLSLALQTGNIRHARGLAAEAEADAVIPRWAVARAKARIALDQQDFDAAKAILVGAIEAHPQNSTLRAQLNEALIASGGAGNARAVQTHLGQPPSLPDGNEQIDTADSA